MKKYDLKKLSEITNKLKKSGKKIGLCHGVFDIIHAGHIRHFEDVKKKCDILVVTVTEDKYVLKGPNRPVNNHFLRAKVLDSLKYIDYVAINYASDATNPIKLLEPNFYFKGKDYFNKKDLTRRLYKEVKAIKKIKGKIIYSNTPLNSSTEIINKTFSYVYNQKFNSFLKNKNKSKIYEKCLLQLEKVKKLKVLLIGDAIIDQYDTVQVLNKPIKENLLATRFLSSKMYLGGIFAAATNLSQFNNDITVCTTIGKDKDLENKIKIFKKKFKTKIFVEKNKVTTRKKRFVDLGYNKKISEVYFMDDNFLGKNNLKKILSFLEKKTEDYDLVILLDYGHSFINSQIYNCLKKKSKFLAINCQTNSANLGFNLITKYNKADYICIDEPELRLATSNNKDDIEKVISKNLFKKINCNNVTITRGQNGCFSYNNKKRLYVPAVISDKVIDTIGAGDVFLVISSLLYKVKSDQLTTSLISNVAGALKVDILGHSKSISNSNFHNVLQHLLK